MQTKKIVLIRHGESLWNKQNKFTGWTDIDLSPNGIEEAIKAGQLLKTKGFNFDIAFTSLLKRAIKTLDLSLDIMDLMWIPIIKSWKLNEKHYGALQGLNKTETALKYGDEQVLKWRRAYDVEPPALDRADPRYPSNDPKYKDLSQDQIPATESLKDTVARVLPFWHSDIAPALKADKKVIVVAHGNSLRALFKYLNNISDQQIVDINIPTGIPLVFELDNDLKTLKYYYLGDPEAVKKAMKSVADQGKV